MGSTVGRLHSTDKCHRRNLWQVRIDLGSDGNIGNLGFGRQPSVIDIQNTTDGGIVLI